MKQRGRKGASLSVAAPVHTIPRQSPPRDLTEFEAEMWVSITNTKPADWFSADTLPLLRSYCKHISHAQVLDADIAAFDPGWLKDPEGLDRFDKLLKMRERESRAITALARSMRLTQQSQVHRETAGTAARKTAARKPWEGV